MNSRSTDRIGPPLTKNIFCVECFSEVKAVLRFGDTIYPHRPDLSELPFWQCPQCKNFVGTHHKSRTPLKPLGVIPSKELKRARKHIHNLLDPMWKTAKVPKRERKIIYKELSDYIGYEYHTAEIRSLEEARKVYLYLLRRKRVLDEKGR
jgi:hypothetical protein